MKNFGDLRRCEQLLQHRHPPQLNAQAAPRARRNADLDIGINVFLKEKALKNTWLSGGSFSQARAISEPRRESVPPPRPEHNTAVAPRCKAPIPVELGLIGPSVAVW